MQRSYTDWGVSRRLAAGTKIPNDTNTTTASHDAGCRLVTSYVLCCKTNEGSFLKGCRLAGGRIGMGHDKDVMTLSPHSVLIYAHVSLALTALTIAGSCAVHIELYQEVLDPEPSWEELRRPRFCKDAVSLLKSCCRISK